MKRRIPRFFRKLAVCILLLAVTAAVIIRYYDLRIRPVAETMAISQMQDIEAAVIHRAVQNVLPSYDNLVTVTTGTDGHVRSVQVDSSRVSRLRTDITMKVMEQLEDISGDSVIEVPLGSLFSYEFFTAKGPLLQVEVLPVTSVYTSYRSEFSSVGINQTLHRIVLTITVAATLLFPSEEQDVVYSVDVVAAETVIVGEVPGLYSEADDDSIRIRGKNILSQEK